MTRPAQIALHDESREQVIDRLYDVALDPARYEALLDHWEGLVGPLRDSAGGADFILNDDMIEAHFDRASKFLDRWETENQQDAAEALLDGFDRTAALLLDDKLDIIALNEGAQQSLGLTIGAAVADMPLEPCDRENFAFEVQQRFAGRADGRGMFRFRSNENGRYIILRVILKNLLQGRRAMLVVTSEVSWPKGFSDLLKGSFGLTSAEADVARGLVECRSVREIAQTRNRSPETVRAQVKSVLSKTETRSQTEAVRLLLSMMDIASYTITHAGQSQDASGGFRQLAEVPFQTLHTAQGRRLDYLVLGDPDGRAVVYFPGDYGLIRLPASAENDAARRGLRIIVPVRAGYGASCDPAKGQSFTQTVCDDLAAVMDACGVKSCPVVTQGSDSFIAISMAHFHPGRIAALVACSGVLPLTRPEQFARMEKWHRFINSSARYTPHLTPFMVKAGFFLARRIGKRGFVHAVYGNTPADVETFDNPEVFEAMVAGSDVALSDSHSAHRSFAANVLDMERDDWSALVAGLQDKFPVVFLNGTQDPQVPEATLREHIDDYPWIAFETFDDAGQLLLFRHWRRVLDHLENFFVQ